MICDLAVTFDLLFAHQHNLHLFNS